MTAQKAAVRILKLAAAHRQLDAAIRMTFADEDVLAIATVAAAASRILRDIKQKRGHNVMAEKWRDDMLAVALSYVRGEMSELHLDAFKRDPECWPLICMLVEHIQTLGKDKNFSELQSSVSVDVSPQTERQHWAEFNKAANFLKHADADHGQSLGEDEVDADRLIATGCELYAQLMGRLTREMEVWSVDYLYVRHESELPADPMRRGIAELLRTVKPSNRNAAAREFISILNADAVAPEGARDRHDVPE